MLLVAWIDWRGLIHEEERGTDTFELKSSTVNARIVLPAQDPVTLITVDHLASYEPGRQTCVL